MGVYSEGADRQSNMVIISLSMGSTFIYMYIFISFSNLGILFQEDIFIFLKDGCEERGPSFVTAVTVYMMLMETNCHKKYSYSPKNLVKILNLCLEPSVYVFILSKHK